MTNEEFLQVTKFLKLFIPFCTEMGLEVFYIIEHQAKYSALTISIHFQS